MNNKEVNQKKKLGIIGAARIWSANHKDEKYMFGYCKNELEKTLKEIKKYE